MATMKFATKENLREIIESLRSSLASKSDAVKNISRSGTTFTATRADGTSFTFTQQDNNTTYSAGSGLSLSGTTFSAKVDNDTIKVNSNGQLYVDIPSLMGVSY